VHADLAFALSLADSADAITMRHFRSPGLGVETKSDLTPVSVADRAAEEAMREAIAGARPDEAVVGEELGGGDAGAARWILDPIDGTKHYVRGIPLWATLIAHEREGSVVAAVASAPALGARWWATRGGGAFADGEPVRVSTVSSLEQASFSHASVRSLEAQGYGEAVRSLGRRAWMERGYGDFWQHMLVAEGRLEFALDPVVSLWDLAAVQLIVEEAGGRFSDFAGAARPDSGSGLSSNGLLHDEVLAALNAG
jgi:histidinol-phosphatase